MYSSLEKYTRDLDSVAIFDPAIATRNAGDEIISDAARKQISKVLPTAFQATIPTHEVIGLRSYRFCHQARYRVVAGSNIAADRMIFDRQWRLRPWDTFAVKDLIFLGVGWRSYRNRRDVVSETMRRRMMSKTALHSVRDEHTRSSLAARGHKNVVNTACVTMWDLDIEALATLPREKAARVVTTVNIGRQTDGEMEMLRLLTKEYDEVHLWPQGIDDLPYIATIVNVLPTVKVLGPTLSDFDALLASEGSLDFVGNRLHGGVRALQHNRRAVILSVDNRASEIARDTNLPVVKLTDGLDRLKSAINTPDPIEISLPVDKIAAWKSQFL